MSRCFLAEFPLVFVCSKVITEDYRAELKEVFAADAQLAEELEFGLKQYQKQQEDDALEHQFQHLSFTRATPQPANVRPLLLILLSLPLNMDESSIRPRGRMRSFTSFYVTCSKIVFTIFFKFFLLCLRNTLACWQLHMHDVSLLNQLNYDMLHA